MFSTQLLCFFVSSHLSLLSLCQWISEAYQWGRGLEEILSWMKNSFPCNDKEAGALGPLPTERRCISQIYHWFTFSEELHLIHNDVHVQKSNFDIRDWGFSCLKSTSKPTESDAKQIFFFALTKHYHFIHWKSLLSPPSPLSLSCLNEVSCLSMVTTLQMLWCLNWNERERRMREKDKPTHICLDFTLSAFNSNQYTFSHEPQPK